MNSFPSRPLHYRGKGVSSHRFVARNFSKRKERRTISKEGGREGEKSWTRSAINRERGKGLKGEVKPKLRTSLSLSLSSYANHTNGEMGKLPPAPSETSSRSIE